MKKALVLMAAVAMVAMLAPMALAATSGTELDSLYTTVRDWLTGVPGKILAVSFIILGIWMARGGQFLWFFGGILLAITLTVIPSIVDSKFSALF